MSENIQSISQGTYTISEPRANDSSLLVTENGENVSILQGTVATSAGIVGDGTTQTPLRADETVLWSGNGTTAFTASEPLTNFERIKFYLNSDANAEISCVEVPMIGRNTSAIKLSWCDNWKNDGQWKFLIWNGVLNNTGMSAFNNNNTTTYLGLSNNFNATGGSYGADCPLFYKVIGVNRKAQ